MPIQITENKKTIPNTPTHLKWVCGLNELHHYIKLLQESPWTLFFCNLIMKQRCTKSKLSSQLWVHPIVLTLGRGRAKSAGRSSCFTKNHYNVVNIYNVYQMMGWTTTGRGSQQGVSIKGFTQTKHAATHWNQLSTKKKTVGKNRFPIATDNNGSPFDIYDLDTNTNNRSGAQVWNRSFTISQ